MDGDRNFSAPQKAAEAAKKYRDILVEFRKSTPDPADDFERFAVEDLILPGWEKAKPKLDGAITEAIGIYDDLIRAEFPKKAD